MLMWGRVTFNICPTNVSKNFLIMREFPPILNWATLPARKLSHSFFSCDLILSKCSSKVLMDCLVSSNRLRSFPLTVIRPFVLGFWLLLAFP